MEMWKIIAACIAMVCLSTTALAQEYAYSPVQVGVLSDSSFTVTLNGEAATASAAMPGTATAVLWFNSTDGGTKKVNASVIGANDQVGPYPTCTTPIAVFKNLGTVNETIFIKVNNSITGVVFFYNASMAGTDTGGLANTTVGALMGAADSPIVTRLYPGNSTNLCIWANFTAVSGGNHFTQFNYSSG
jgi:hypothetical protein